MCKVSMHIWFVLSNLPFDVQTKRNWGIWVWLWLHSGAIYRACAARDLRLSTPLPHIRAQVRVQLRHDGCEHVCAICMWGMVCGVHASADLERAHWFAPLSKLSHCDTLLDIRRIWAAQWDMTQDLRYEVFIMTLARATWWNLTIYWTYRFVWT